MTQAQASIRKSLKSLREAFLAEQRSLQDALQIADNPRPEDNTNHQVFALQRLKQIDAELAEIVVAEDNLRNGKYGICAQCEQSIPPDRLEAKAHALLCVPCQEAADQLKSPSPPARIVMFKPQRSGVRYRPHLNTASAY